MATVPGLRVGDADREAVAVGLREHFAQGRLTLDEFQQRLDAVFAAKTDLDLARITSDLPHAGGYAQQWPPARPPIGRLLSGQGSWQGSSWQGSRSRSSALASLASLVLIAVMIAVVAGLFLPFALFGLSASRPLLVVLAILMLGRRLLRRLLGGGPIRSRRRRWRV